MSQERRTVLAVDDEPAIRTLLQTILRFRGYDCLAAATGEEGIALFREHRASIRLVLMDVDLPGISGVDAVDAIRSLDPAVRCVFLTGYAGGHSPEALLSRGSVLKKPFPLSELLATIGDPPNPPPKQDDSPGRPLSWVPTMVL